jgi:hypothetical protein
MICSVCNSSFSWEGSRRYPGISALARVEVNPGYMEGGINTQGRRIGKIPQT